MTGRSQTGQHQVDPTLHGQSHGSTQHQVSDDHASDDQAWSSPTGSSRSSHESDNYTSTEIVEDGMLAIPLCTDPHSVRQLRRAVGRPIINKDTLHAIDLDEIEKNIKLRIDINFDHHINFSPSGGRNAEDKQMVSAEYWEALAAELKILCQHNIMAKCDECEERLKLGETTQYHFRPRLEKFLVTLKELLMTMTQYHEWDQICHYLDVSLRMQEASHGMLDASWLGQWLSRLLIRHCAPVRDAMAREMARTIDEGMEKGDFFIITDGIRQLFELLEVMKLDVANNSLRRKRYSLIDDTVKFQRGYFRNRMEAGRIMVRSSRLWFQMATERHESCPQYPLQPRSPPLAALVHGLVSIAAKPNFSIPESLFYDTRRINFVQRRVQDLVNLRLCFDVFEGLVYKMMGLEETGDRGNSALQNCIETQRRDLKARLLDLYEDTSTERDTTEEIEDDNTSHIALEILRSASVVIGEMQKTEPEPLSDDLVEDANDLLQEAFEREADTMGYITPLVLELEETAQAQARAYENMTPLAISDAQKRWAEQRWAAKERPLIVTVEDLARRIAHISVIHCRVWADLLYLAPDELFEA
ncbi:hypothetical protein B0A52_06916 [Exophiala mesophila]|uniref:Uncharacterized protein n=1 Tax=Exophiala mesophila TaxID=212818 RepID=A0A438N0W1_EXOME|nr:hypothetical protein B0A52_06916 [Exophiala mesophila]